MSEKPTYESLEQRVLQLEKSDLKRKKAEDALRESEERFRRFFMNAPLPYQSLDENGNFIEVNSTFLEILGYSQDEVIGKNFGDFLHPDYIAHFKENFPRFKSVGEVLGVEFEMIKKDGSTILVSFNGKIQRNNQGFFQRTHCIFQDITERKRSEEALRNSESTLNLLLETIPIPVFYKDREGRYLGFNKAFEVLFGKSKEQLIGKSVFDISPPELAKIYHAKDVELFETPSVQVYDSQAQDANGVLHNVIFHKASLTNTQGSVTGLIGAVIDITERKQAEERLQQSEESLRAITNSAQDAILMLDPEGRVSFWNPAAEHIFGYTRVEAIGQNLHDLIAPSRFHQAHHSGFQVFRQTGQGSAVGKTLDLEARRKDGQEISVQLSLSAVQMNDGWHAVGLVRDITERKLAEEKLKFANVLLSTQQEATIDGILVVDEKAHILSYNRRFVEMWGLPEKLVEERVDESVLQFVTAQLADPRSFLSRVQYLYEHRQEISQDELFLADGRVFERYTAPMFGSDNQYYGRVWYFRDISKRKHAEHELQRYSVELEKSNNELKDALANVKQLTGLLPICASCKKIRDDKGYWSEVESYIADHTSVLFSHGICPECEEKLYPEFSGKELAKEENKHG